MSSPESHISVGVEAPREPLSTEARLRKGPGGLVLRSCHRVRDLAEREWDASFRGRGLFDYRALQTLEDAFGTTLPEAERWRPYYYEMFREGRCVLRTVFTASRCKDDMTAPAAVSKLAEQRRESDPGFLVSRIFCMGSLLSEGNHLYLERGEAWQEALHFLIDAIEEDATNERAATLVVGQIAAGDEELAEQLGQRGFAALPFPDGHDLDPGASHDRWMSALSPKSRRHQRKEVIPYLDHYEARVERGAELDPASLEEFREIYLRVRKRNLEINDFPLPLHFWQAVAEASRIHPEGFEFLTLRHRRGDLLAAGIGYRSGSSYIPTVLGLAGDASEHPGLYRVALAQVVARAREVGATLIRFGPGAPLEKRRFGARPMPLRIHVQFKEPERLAALGELMAEVNSRS